nr:PPE domain-containing protein [Mycobacterium sp. Z3061]
MDFPLLAPEINSALIYGGAGSDPWFAVAEAWDGLAAELGAAAASFGRRRRGLVGGAWQGAAASAMLAAAAPTPAGCRPRRPEPRGPLLRYGPPPRRSSRRSRVRYPRQSSRPTVPSSYLW